MYVLYVVSYSAHTTLLNPPFPLKPCGPTLTLATSLPNAPVAGFLLTTTTVPEVPDRDEVTRCVNLHGARIRAVGRGHDRCGDRARGVDGEDSDGVVVGTKGLIGAVGDSNVVALLCRLASGRIDKLSP
jgi:hypothetical protein